MEYNISKNPKDTFLSKIVNFNRPNNNFTFYDTNDIINKIKQYKTIYDLRHNLIFCLFLGKNNNTPKTLKKEKIKAEQLFEKIKNNLVTEEEKTAIRNKYNYLVFLNLCRSIKWDNSIEDIENLELFTGIIKKYFDEVVIHNRKRKDLNFYIDIFTFYFVCRIHRNEIYNILNKKYDMKMKSKGCLTIYLSPFKHWLEEGLIKCR